MPAQLIDREGFRRRLGAGEDPLPLFREALKQGSEAIIERFRQGEPVVDLVHLRAHFIDLLLQEAWALKIPHDADAALVAVGGYGRGELHPASDIDLLILLGESDYEHLAEPLGELLTFFWDIGLEVGHSVRTVAECVSEAEQDVTIATTLMESRLLTGPAALFEALRSSTGGDRIWPSDRFFDAKIEEQRRRYEKYENSISALEPNIKESPGGLRDIQTIHWVVKRHFGADTLSQLVTHGFLTSDEYDDLKAGTAFLWRIRFALHILAGRREDRILFDYQRTLAEQFGYHDDERELGVERFMQRYFTTALRMSRMNEMLLQLFQEVIVLKCHLDLPKPINRRFQSRSGYLEVVDDQVFDRTPLAMLEMFLVMAQHPELNGVRASTIRLIRSRRHLIDGHFRHTLAARSLFMEIMRQPRGLTRALRSMNRYGILARYIPPFANVVGRMQYDLFHVYTVDEHTLFVIRNLRRFMVEEHRHEFPLCSDIMERLPKPELLFLAGLFHDVGKGRGGDHSRVGAVDALDFCRLHQLSEHDSRLVAWLVENHLLMSITAQRRDISDPDVVREFASHVGDPVRLDYLYLLTIADIRATDPKKWNNWKNSLLRELYYAAKQALLRGLENPQEREEIIQNKQAGARHLLVADGLDAERINRYWLTLSLDYFLHHTWEEIAWQTKVVLTATPEQLPLVLVRNASTRGGSEVFTYGHDDSNLFAVTTSVLDQLGLNIVSARIETSDTGCTIDSFIVLEEDGRPIDDPARKEEIQAVLRQALINPSEQDLEVSRRVPRQLKHFAVQTRIDFVDDPANLRTIMKLVAADRPGLLSQVGYAFGACGIRLINAKIATIGAEAEDTFFITDQDNRPLRRKEQFECLEQAINERLSSTAP
ncbi:MAG TPA: [protein-PII] uridylyltransferase [Sedimenticola thiotaurini]|uniref:Bifunctional uridylyltransferase/uridylyl-removing enzyme n=1 Tax=Sedimenticola thiotaurini TaxID=1543721 RepID=A0A831RNE4_9GAMM|nr:[protein-PII] uridylyltransferase [Sedimenticola thiotaurini]